MTRHVLLGALLGLGLCVFARAEAMPFALPPGAKVVVGDGKGWLANGELKLSFKAAQNRLATTIAASGWLHLHVIELGQDRVLDTWTRGDEELTVMVWRISAGRSGFSYGISAKDVSSGKGGGR